MGAILLGLLSPVLYGQVDDRALRTVRLRVNGVELHYVERGRGEPLILLHGGVGDLRSWGPQLDALSRHYHVISYSRRYNHPNRNEIAARDHSAHVEAEDLAALIAELRLGEVHLVGTSYGAFTALALALERPGSVRSLVLAEPPVHQWVRDRPGGEALYRDFMARVHEPAAAAFRRGDARGAMRILTDGFAGAPRFDGLPPEAVAALMQNTRAMEALTRSRDPYPKLSKERVSRLGVPVLIITGQRTIEIHRRVDEELARLLPAAEHVTIAGAGHGPARENPEAFNEAVLAFLADLGR